MKHGCCPVEKSIKLIGGKWTILILRDLFYRHKKVWRVKKVSQRCQPKDPVRQVEISGKRGYSCKKDFSRGAAEG